MSSSTIDNLIAALDTEIAHLQSQLADVEHWGNIDIRDRLVAGIARRTRRLEGFRVQRDHLAALATGRDAVVRAG